MKIIIRMVIFGTSFSVGFFVIRYFDIIPMHVLISETSGIGYLYSAIGLIFGIISAFVIQIQWDNWNNLLLSVHGEIKSLRRLLLFSSHISSRSNLATKQSIIQYLEQVIIHWHQNGKKKSHKEVADAIKNIYEHNYTVKNEKKRISTTENEIVQAILNYHDDVMLYSARRLPAIVKNLIQFNVILVIFLPLFIGVKTLWLDYITTLSIALLAFLIYLVITDLNNPLTPGNWHITSEEYQQLLEELNKQN